jgi:hypothetical protein
MGGLWAPMDSIQMFAGRRLDAARCPSRRFGFRRHYRLPPWTDMVEVYWGSRCQIYVTPVNSDEIGVALLSRDAHLRLDAALSEFPAMQSRLATARQTSEERGAATTTRHLPGILRTYRADWRCLRLRRRDRGRGNQPLVPASLRTG